jgi:hypothetical protein
MTTAFFLITTGLYLLTPYILTAACILTGLYAAYRRIWFRKVTVHGWSDTPDYTWIRK